MNRTDKIFFALAWLLFGLLALAAVLQKTGLFSLTDIPAECSFRHVTGLYCPGCGGTHAIVALASGQLIRSFLYHPLVLYTAACFAIFTAWNSICCLYRLCHKKRTHAAGPFRCFQHFAHFHILYVYVGIGIIFVQWIVKNCSLLLEKL